MEKDIWAKYRSQGLVVLGVNAREKRDPEKMAKQFVSEHGVTYPVLMDTEEVMWDSYHVEGLPTIAIIDRKGVLKYLEPGFDEESVTAEVEKLLAEK
jgi:peroxiredoxin